jgi:hypothetical protein
MRQNNVKHDQREAAQPAQAKYQLNIFRMLVQFVGLQRGIRERHLSAFIGLPCMYTINATLAS